MKGTTLFFLTLLRLSFAYHLGLFVPLSYDTFTDFDNTKSGQAYAHALTIAIDDVNSDPNILPGHNLTYSWTNSTDRNEVLRAMYQKYISPNAENDNATRTVPKVDAFIGPAFHCTAPAKVAQAFNVPMISYFCAERGSFSKNEYPLFVQTFQNTNAQAAATLFALLDSRKWSRIGIIYEEADPYWEDLWLTILKRDNVKVAKSKVVPKKVKFQKYGEYFLQKPEMQERNESLKIVRDTLTDMRDNHIKIFVLLMSFEVLVEVMSQAYDLGLTEKNKPHRAFISFQLNMGVTRETQGKNSDLYRSPIAEPRPPTSVMMRAKKASRSLLLISLDKPRDTERFQKFKNELVKRTDNVPPFKDPYIYDFKTHDTQIPEAGTALYDAVYQYALALDRLHRNGSNITAKAVIEEFRRKPYVGISGYESAFATKTGILKVHLSLLQITKEITTEEDMRSTHLETIGQFDYSPDTDKITLRLDNDKISWPWGTEDPKDKKNCADDGFDCPKKDVNVAQSVVPIVISVVFVVIFFVLIALFLRQWKRERVLKRSVWQIDINDIIFDRKISTDSKFSDDSGAGGVSALAGVLSSQIRTSMRDLESYSLLDDGDTKEFFPNNNAIVEECGEIISLDSFSAMKSISGSYKNDRVFVKVLPRNVDISKPMQRELRMLRHIHHENLNPFIGLGCENSYIWIVMQLGSKGTLEEVLANPDITLDHRFILSLVYDIAKGMTFLHSSDIKSHGNLKSSNCVVDNRWVLKITDYGIPDIRSRQARYMGPNNEEKKFRELLWKAPELLREADPPICGTKKGDVYSFAIILEEFHTLKAPYSNSNIPARAIVDRIVDGEFPPYRPIVTLPIENAERLVALMKDCWRETPEKRPSFQEIKYEVEGAMTRCGLKTDICDNMITLLENYSNELEHVVSQRTRQLREEKHKTDALLDRMLPRSVAEQLKRGETVQAESFSSVTIYFSDIVQFTALCAESTPMQVVDMLNDLYLLFDDIIMDYSVYKVETIGDAYMVVSGLPTKNGKLHASEISCMALEILDSVKKFKVGHKPEHELQIRIGIHTGPVVAGVVGMTMPRYCLFGDTVNTASRMESNGKELQIHVSGSTKEILDELGGFSLKQREGEVYLKGKGNCITYWLEGASADVPRCPRKLSKKAMKPLFQNTDSRKYSQPFRTRKKTQISFPRASVA